QPLSQQRNVELAGAMLLLAHGPGPQDGVDLGGFQVRQGKQILVFEAEFGGFAHGSFLLGACAMGARTLAAACPTTVFNTDRPCLASGTLRFRGGSRRNTVSAVALTMRPFSRQARTRGLAGLE